MVSGFFTSPWDHSRIFSGEASPIRIASNVDVYKRQHHRRPARTDTSPGPGKMRNSWRRQSRPAMENQRSWLRTPWPQPSFRLWIRCPSQGSHPGTRPRCPGIAPVPPLHFLRSCKDSRRPQPRPAFTRFYCQYMSRAKTVECFPKKTYNKTMKTTPEPESSGPQGGT